MSEKKKILVLIDWFAPGYKAGGPIQSCVNFAFAMKDAFKVAVLTTDTDHGEKDAYEGIRTGEWMTNLHPDITVLYLQKSTLGLAEMKRRIKEADADYVYLNLLFSPLFVVYPLWLKYTGQLKGEVVLCPRGTLYESALSVKRWKKTPFLKLFRWMGIHKRILFHATNQREEKAILHYFPGSRIMIADNLPNSNQPPLLSCPKDTGTLKCVFIARIVPIKNLLFLLRALDKINASRVELSVVGPAEDKEYWDECQQKITELGTHIKVNYLGPRKNNELLPILQQHHLFVLPTTGENFGHSIFEAFLAGRPVLISDQTPWLRLTPEKIGWDLPLKEELAFTQAIEEAARWDQADFDQWAGAAWQYARHFIENPELHRQYINLFA